MKVFQYANPRKKYYPFHRSSSFLILFDGESEVKNDKTPKLRYQNDITPILRYQNEKFSNYSFNLTNLANLRDSIGHYPTIYFLLFYFIIFI